MVSVDETEDTTEAQVYTFNNGYLDVDLELIDQGGEFVEVSQDLFDEIYPEQTTQASAYISHYTKTAKVIKNFRRWDMMQLVHIRSARPHTLRARS